MREKTFRLTHLVFQVLMGVALLALSAFLLTLIAAILTYTKLPDIPELISYRPALPLKIMSADGELLGEFGLEKRDYVAYDAIPKQMRDALLAIEDARFFEHSGVDVWGVARAALKTAQGNTQAGGASTITMQVARNFYLSRERSLKRKLFETLLAFKIDHEISKEQILEIYMNQIYLGHRAFGFASAAKTYFGKPLAEISIAEAAMLAGLPKAPSSINPIDNFARAQERQQYILQRMLELSFIDQSQYQEALETPLVIRSVSNRTSFSRTRAQYVAEMARQMVLEKFGEAAYSRGLVVHTTINYDHQNRAYQTLREALTNFDRRKRFRRVEGKVTLPNDLPDVLAQVDQLLATHPDSGEFLGAIVLSVNNKKITALLRDGQTVEVFKQGMQRITDAKGNLNSAIVRGSIVRLIKLQTKPHNKNSKANSSANKETNSYWEITQLPEVQGAFISLKPHTGEILALVGGFDFGLNKFNHVTQAWRQPGSVFKPFMYSAAIEKGVSADTVVYDEPINFVDDLGNVWQPKNYDNKYDGPMTVRSALEKSKNMVSIRILDAIGIGFARNWVQKFGFAEKNIPPYLTMALGTGVTTPLEIASAYAVFANQGLYLEPQLITKITDSQGKEIVVYPRRIANEANRVISERNSYVMNHLLNGVTLRGTAARIYSELKRDDLYGKTGTTNNSQDVWFAGFHPNLVGVVWIGYDQPRNLGDHETGGGLALPVWINYMNTALHDEPVLPPSLPPAGLVASGDDYLYEEFAGANGIAEIGATFKVPASISTKERESLLQFFQQAPE